MKRCTRCHHARDASEFPIDRKRRDGLFPWCRPCKAADMRERRRAGKDVTNSIAPHGLTLEQFEEMLDSQGGVCAICRLTRVNARRLRLGIDHNHTTDSIRGLLCDRCNMMIGLGDDDPERLRRAAEYVENPPFDIPRPVQQRLEHAERP